LSTSEKPERLVIVSNRLPFRVRIENGGLQFGHSVGGLATGLSAYLESQGKDRSASTECVWVGWPGGAICEEMREEVRDRSLAEFSAIPVFLEEEEVQQFYHGFCNRTIWPLFHYFQVYTNFDEECWEQYIRVNEIFCRAVLEFVSPNDTIWIHDYHLMLLPQMIREHLPSSAIGWFLHIPFPNFEIFRLLPSKWRRRILEGLLGADLVGFHTNDFKQDFLRCVLRILGRESNMGTLVVGNRLVRADSFPMGINFQKYHCPADMSEIDRRRSELGRALGEERIILSVDRLDYTKGIINRLEGYETFLERNSAWLERVSLILIVVPSRLEVEHYEIMKNQIEGLVGRINGQFGSIWWTPIIYQYKTLTFQPLAALYTLGDVALVTPLRDGMNLIAKEYIASRRDKTGVLILSEMAGAAKELGEAILVNPNNREEIAEALLEALEMPEEEQVRRNTIMQGRLKRYDVVRWVSDFMQELETTRQLRERYLMRMMSSEARDELRRHYQRSERRLLFLDYDGILVPFAVRPQLAVPDEELLEVLSNLSRDSRNEVVIISGRDKEFLDSWFSSLPISLVAEHGVWLKESGQIWRLIRRLSNDWKPNIMPILERYADRMPGTFVEEKDHALVWHFRAADPEPAKMAAQELNDYLRTFTANIDIQVLQGSKSIEVRNAGVNKGSVALQVLAKARFDFILAVGDELSDEDLFSVLPERAHSLRVGVASTHARYSLSDHKEVLQLLARLAAP